MQNQALDKQDFREIPIKTDIFPAQQQPQPIDFYQPLPISGVKRKSKAQSKGKSSFSQVGDNYICLTHAKKMTLVEAVLEKGIQHIYCDICNRYIDRIKCNYSKAIHLNLAKLQGVKIENENIDQLAAKKVGEKRKYPFRFRCDECPEGGLDVCLKCINDDKTYLPQL
ncbi:hypothetical protein FGO68_gene7372 [Halteria grandinella]|uniref:Uncharacterized protein n=1 Tax=Halteria grandinella TaxID=5974 RepID=A0A8J8NNW3_HALGN|nr:hypothetical protein FGO68_gene7372 [Halteria grandinella]